MKKARVAAVGLSLALLPTIASAQTVLRFGHMNSPTHFVNVEGQAMAEAIAERTGGEVTVEMFPSGQLGENSQVTEQISLGGEMIGQVGVGTLAAFVPDYSIIVYPFLYPDYETAQKFLETDLVRSWEAKVEESNVKVLCYFAFGIRDLYTRDREVRTPEDSSGLKIRVQPATIYTEMVRLTMNGSPTPMPWPDVYSALSQGVIDSAEAPPSSILDQKHFEVAKYLSQTNHILDLSPLVMSASAFDALTEEQQAVVEEEADLACDRMTATSVAGYEEGIAKLREAGMTIISDLDREAFASKAAGIAEAFPEWTPGLYEEVRGIVETLK